MKRVFAFGLGYCAETLARRASEFRVSGTVRSPEKAARLRQAGIEAFVFDGARLESGLQAALQDAEILLISAAPDAAGDPALTALARESAAAPKLERVLYLSTVGVYGDAGGAWVDEGSPTLGRSPRSLWRLAAEQAWLAFGRERGVAVDILRLAGIYGPGRSPLAKLLDGTSRRIVKPGQVFNRIHVDDIADVARALVAAGGAGGVWNVADLEPAPPQDVIVYAASLLGVTPPPEEAYETAEMTAMARSFYADNRRVSVDKLKRELGYVWNFPTYREGLQACLAAP